MLDNVLSLQSMKVSKRESSPLDIYSSRSFFWCSTVSFIHC